MRALIYCRVSTAEQTKNLSLETQEKACREYCARHGFDVARTFIDAGESARSVDRPEFARMLAYCRTRGNRVDAVVVYALTRFSRNNADHHAIATLLRGLGIILRSVTEPIDDSPSGRLMEGILASMAQFDNDQRAERTRAGMQAAVARGRWIWMAPPGYITGSPQQGRPSLAVDPVRAPLIREAFELVASGRLTGRPLLEHLTSRGLRGRRGRPLVLSRLYALLRNPIYTGRIRTRRGQDVDGDFEALVSPGVFAVVQHRLGERGAAIKQASRHVNHPDFPLRRFVRCAACEGTLTGGWSHGRSKRYARYHCQRGCTSLSVEALHDAFSGLLGTLVPRPGYLRVLKHAVLEDWRAQRVAGAGDQARLRSEISRAEARLVQLDQAYIFDQRIDAGSYRTQRDLLREQRAIAEVQLGSLRDLGLELEERLTFATDVLENAAVWWKADQSPDDRARLQVALFPEGVVWTPTPRERASAGHFIAPRNVLQFFGLDGILENASNWGG